MVLYGISSIYSIFLWRKGFRKDDLLNYSLLTAALVFHWLAMFKRGVSLQRCPTHNLFEATMFIGWGLMLATLALGAWRKLRFLTVFAAPILFGLGVFALMPSLDAHNPKPELRTAALSLHVALSLLAYGGFGLSAAAGFMFLTQEHDLKFHKKRALFSLLPPITRLEKVITWMTLAGFVLLTAGLLFGFFWVPLPAGAGFFGDFKVLWSAVVWLLYLVLLVLHWKFAQRGRRLAWGSIGGFVFVLLTYWGASLASPLHNP